MTWGSQAIAFAFVTTCPLGRSAETPGTLAGGALWRPSINQDSPQNEAHRHLARGGVVQPMERSDGDGLLLVSSSEGARGASSGGGTFRPSYLAGWRGGNSPAVWGLHAPWLLPDLGSVVCLGPSRGDGLTAWRHRCPELCLPSTPAPVLTSARALVGGGGPVSLALLSPLACNREGPAHGCSGLRADLAKIVRETDS